LHDGYDDHDRKAVRLDRVTSPHHTKHEIRTGRRGGFF